MLKYLVYFLAVNLCDASKVETSEDALVQRIVNLKPYQTMIFLDNSTEDRIPRKISAGIPTITVDVGRLRSTDRNVSDPLFAFPKTRKSTLLIITQENFDADKAKSILDLYTHLSFKYIRPKCLLITTDEGLQIDALHPFLHQAWSNKFLDLSIVNLVDDVSESRLYTFNPFFNNTCIFSAPNAYLFPNKLIDMNGFAFTVPFLEFKPYLYISTVNNVTKYNGFEYILANIYATKLNFKIKFMIEEGYFLKSLHKVMNSEFHVMLLPTYLTKSVYQSNLEFGEIQSFVHYRGLTLHMTKSIIKISYVTLIFSTINLLMLFFATYLINCFIVIREQVGLFQNVRLLLGQPTNRVPSRTSARIIFVFFSILSQFYTQQLTSKMTGALVPNSDLIISSYQDLLASNLPIYMHKGMLEILDNSSDRHLKIIRSKIIEYEKPYYCEELLARLEDVFCLIPETEGKYSIEMYRGLRDVDTMKLQHVLFPMIAEAYAYEPGSPFVEKFNAITRVLIESGLHGYHKRMYHYTTSHVLDWANDEYSINELAIFQFFAIYLTGCTVSFVVLILEFSNWKIKHRS